MKSNVSGPWCRILDLGFSCEEQGPLNTWFHIAGAALRSGPLNGVQLKKSQFATLARDTGEPSTRTLQSTLWADPRHILLPGITQRPKQARFGEKKGGFRGCEVYEFRVSGVGFQGFGGIWVPRVGRVPVRF